MLTQSEQKKGFKKCFKNSYKAAHLIQKKSQFFIAHVIIIYIIHTYG